MKLIVISIFLSLSLISCVKIDLTKQFEESEKERWSSLAFKEVNRWISFAYGEREFFENGDQDYLYLLDSLGLEKVKEFEQTLYDKYLSMLSDYNAEVKINNFELLLQSNDKELIFRSKKDKDILYDGDTMLFYEDLKDFLIILKFNLTIKENENNHGCVISNENYYYNIKYISGVISSIERYLADYNGNLINI